MDNIHLHRITLKSREVLDSAKAHMSCQYFSGTSRPDTSHIIQEVLITDGYGEFQRVRALMDCGAKSVSMALRLRKWLGLAEEPAYITILGPNIQMVSHTNNGQNTAFTGQYKEHLSLVAELEVLVVPLRAHYLVLRLPWFQSRNTDDDWQSGRHLALRTPGGAEVVAVDRIDHQECNENEPGSMDR